MPQLMEQCSRSAPNPECISAVAQRAQARAATSAGHTARCFSARYSAIASESQIVYEPSTRQGTLPEGENFLNELQLEPASNGTRRSSKSRPSSRISTQERSDQEEEFLLAM